MSSVSRVNAASRPSTPSQTNGEERARRGIRLAALRAPLVIKLLGANLAIVMVLVALGVGAGLPLAPRTLIIIALAILAHTVAVLFALQPIRELESVARRVWHGDYAARVESSSVTDTEVLRVGSMFNVLLDGLAADRARMRELARDVIDTGDRERSTIARELQDSTAQHVAALLYELSAAARDAQNSALRGRLEAARDAAEEILEEIRQLSHIVHSAVLDDLGLTSALKRLARDSSHGNGINVDVQADVEDRLPRNVEAALFRVAQEAALNATRHASPKQIHLLVRRREGTVVMQIHDDGKGFRVAETIELPTSRGLASMRQRLALVDGTLTIDSSPTKGTTITASVPVAS